MVHIFVRISFLLRQKRSAVLHGSRPRGGIEQKHVIISAPAISPFEPRYRQQQQRQRKQLQQQRPHFPYALWMPLRSDAGGRRPEPKRRHNFFLAPAIQQIERCNQPSEHAKERQQLARTQSNQHHQNLYLSASGPKIASSRRILVEMEA